jgi:hypothetical protein
LNFPSPAAHRELMPRSLAPEKALEMKKAAQTAGRSFLSPLSKIAMNVPPCITLSSINKNSQNKRFLVITTVKPL